MKNALKAAGVWLAGTAWPWIVAKANRERVLVVTTAMTLLYGLSDALTGAIGWGNLWQLAVPTVIGLIVRVFVTSEDVTPGWRREV